MDDTKPKRKGRQLFDVPMKRYTVFLDALTVAHYKARGGGSLAKGLRVVASEANVKRDEVPF